MPEPAVPVSVVVVTHNEGDLLRATIDSLAPTLPAGGEIIVVDDDSSDASTGFLDEGYLNARVLRPPGRLGAPGARRYGACEAAGEIVVFSDAHVEVPEGWLEKLADALAEPDAGLVAPAISSLGNRAVRGYGRTWKDPALGWKWLGRVGKDDAPYAVPLLSGCFVASRSDTLREMGGFDPGFIIWGEEGADLSLRYWRRGLECRVVPSVEVAHLFRPSFPFEFDSILAIHNQLRLAVLHFSEARMARVVEVMRKRPAFSEAMAKVLAGDVWAQRVRLAEVSIRDDDWFFERFPVEGL